MFSNNDYRSYARGSVDAFDASGTQQIVQFNQRLKNLERFLIWYMFFDSRIWCGAMEFQGKLCVQIQF